MISSLGQRALPRRGRKPLPGGVHLLSFDARAFPSVGYLLSRLRAMVQRWRRALAGPPAPPDGSLPPDEPDILDTDDGPLRPWQWKLRESRAGPNHCARLCFIESVPGRLESAVRRVELAGFEAFDYADGEGLPVLSYMDRFNAPRFARNLKGDGGGNIWTYRTVEVRGSRLSFTNGYGTWDPETLTAQTTLLHRLCTAEAGLTLAEWWIYGNESGMEAEGTGWAELLAHLTLPARPA